MKKKSSKNKGANYNEWLHPDIVGFKDLIVDYTKEVKECLVQCAGERSCLYAFEVKDAIIQTGNLRKFFFQTVSNSSWANYSYLVATGVEEKAETELQLLCTSFKIGFIQLNKEYPEDSQIRIQAPKTEVDWDMINRITKENTDFQQYIKNILLAHLGHTSPNIKKPLWD